MCKIGILAYGSLIGAPGCEIEAETLYKLEGVLTPFHVEFARCSKTRGCAPTLVPVVEGGAHVKAVILVLKERVSLKKAKNMLWRREINQVCSNEIYKPSSKCIKELKTFKHVDTVIYTSLEPNIANSTPCELAKLAIESVCSTQKEKGRDGISYLIKAKRNGIKTPKMDKYEEKIKSLTGTKSLEYALVAVKKSCP
jgi:cation transport regulator ChaC